MYEGCKLIVIEGPDKLGKTTQCMRLAASLAGACYQKIPNRDGVTYDRIYEMLKTGEAAEEPYYFQSLNGINRLIWQRQMLPALAQQYKYIILDRWNPSTWVYGQSIGMTERQCGIVTKGLISPDLCFVFQGTPLERSGKDDAYESDDKLQQEVAMRYNVWADSNPEIVVKVNANRSMSIVTEELLSEIQKRTINT